MSPDTKSEGGEGGVGVNRGACCVQLEGHVQKYPSRHKQSFLSPKKKEGKKSAIFCKNTHPNTLTAPTASHSKRKGKVCEANSFTADRYFILKIHLGHFTVKSSGSKNLVLRQSQAC